MFGWFKSKEAATAVIDAPVPEPKAADLGAMPEAHYIKTAMVAGLAESATVIMARLREVLADRSLYVYDMESVETYLDKHFGGDHNNQYTDRCWTWQAVSPDDAVIDLNRHGGWANGCVLKRERYQGAVPLPVVETIHALREAIPSLKFFISGESDRMPAGDPFLAVWHPSLADLVVVERWDEPGFRG
jgi:hypothetical protein